MDFNEGYKVLVEMDLVILMVRAAPVYILTSRSFLIGPFLTTLGTENTEELVRLQEQEFLCIGSRKEKGIG